MRLPHGIRVVKTEKIGAELVMTVEIAWWYVLYIKIKNIPRAIWYTLKTLTHDHDTAAS